MTWWKKLIDKTGISLLKNNSWNGSCASTVNGVATSGVERCMDLSDTAESPDIIIVGAFGANDWANSDKGSYDFATALPDIDVDLTDETSYSLYEDVVETYAGAMATMFKRIHEKYPFARVYAFDMYNYYRGHYLDPAGWSNDHNVPDYNKILYDVSEYFGVKVIKLSECGINAINSETYCVDAATGTALHPNASGHTLIYKKVISAILPDFNKNYKPV